MTDLKPCPFCGGNAFVDEGRVIDETRCESPSVTCATCLSSVGGITLSEAIALWNTRRVTPEERIRDEKAKAWDICYNAAMFERESDGKMNGVTRETVLIKGNEIEQLKKEAGV